MVLEFSNLYVIGILRNYFDNPTFPSLEDVTNAGNPIQVYVMYE